MEGFALDSLANNLQWSQLHKLTEGGGYQVGLCEAQPICRLEGHSFLGVPKAW